jgi:hypothetical protein
MPMPRRNHQTASLLRLIKACAEANGTPLSLRMLAGDPRSVKSLSKCGKSVVFSGGELSLVVDAPELVGALTQRERSSLGAPPGMATALDKAVAIEQRLNGTVGRNFNPRKSANQTLRNLSSTPGGVLVLQVQDVVLYSEGQLVCVVTGPPASVCEPPE